MLNKKSIGAIVASICIGLLPVKGQNNPDLPAKGQIKSVVTLPAPGIGSVFSIYESNGFGSWNLNGFKNLKSTLSTRAYKSNASLSATSAAVQLPALSEGDQLFVKVTDEFSLESNYDLGQLLISSDGGTAWSSIYGVSGKTDKRTAWINLSDYAGKSVQLAFSFKSDASFESTGWTIHELSIVKGNSSAVSSNMRMEAAGGVINITGVNTSNFPEYVYVDFEYLVNGVQQPNALSLKDIDLKGYLLNGQGNPGDVGACPLRLYGPDATKRQVDIMFLIDNSGSMSDKQAQVISNIGSFVNSIGVGNDVAFGMLRFGQSTTPIENLELLPGSLGLPSDNFTKEIPYYEGELTARNNTSGWQERGYEAMELGLTANFRASAQKIFILITDENTTDPSNMGPTTKAKVIADLQAKNVVVYAWIPTDTDYNATYADVATQTGGLRYDISQPLTGLNTIIANAVKGTYTLRYCPAYTTVDATQHNAEITIISDPNKVSDSKTWVAAPSQEFIIRDPATAAKETAALPEATATSDYCFLVRDNAGPYPASAQFFMKTVGSTGAFTAINMVQSTATAPYVQKWCATIPPSSILRPGFAYYAVATYPDGHQLKSPPTKEAFFAWNQAVLPNQPPVITVTSATPASVPSCTSANIQFTVSDNTANYTNVTLYYRETGSLSAYTAIDVYTYPGTGTAPTSGTYTLPFTVTGTGLDYYITATDSYGITSVKGDPNAPLKITTTAVPTATNVGNRMTMYFNNTVRLQCTALQVGDRIVAWYTDACGNEAIGGETTVSNAALTRQTLYAYGNTLTTGKNGFDASEGVQLYIVRAGKRYDIEFTPTNPYPAYAAGGILSASSVSYAPSITYNPRYNGTIIPRGDVTPSLAEGTKFDVNYGQDLLRSYTMNASGCGGVTYYGIVSSDPSFEVVMTNYTTGDFTIRYYANVAAKATITIQNSDLDYSFDVEGNPVTCTKAVNYNTTLVADGDATPTVAEGTDFGTVSAAVTRSFVLSGTGCSPALAITAVSSSNPTDFTVTNSGNTISVKYNAVSDASAVVTITTNNGPYTFTVIGKRPACNTLLKYGTVTVANNDASPSTTEGTDFGVTTVAVSRTFTLTPTTCTPLPTILSASSNDAAFTTSISGANVTVTYNASVDAVGTITLNTNYGAYAFDVVGVRAANCATKDYPASNIITQYGAQVRIKLNVTTATGYAVGVSGQFISLASGMVLQNYPLANYGTSYPYWENYIGSGTNLVPGTYRLRLVVTNNGACNGIFNYDFVVQ